ncbi:hypothetical protein BCR41DRAFT_373296 [Lobosporangium transversale]|uniref:Crinkler effector protein N-terminal domain-containing protein n=1 Tax=Lobosporangium transversale TaxID=64571 RepID=A0A1Y2GE20_9FUNG|nr:hypothetical protein BCR41DRAFT_373296 [Lobosporangium transversale]ORZ08263.1 hypothetical protein BCR41DRAFT_373296 [Lobosporangium transversale]|eukprot:XP_021878346.1 hypothetical protein BCR41DRAFT_373296 [Lobosporangium transversale]
MSTQKIKLFCILDGDSSGFEVKLENDDTIAALKDAIKEKQSPLLDDIRASELKIGAKKGVTEISEVFGASSAKKTIHVIVQRPSAVVNIVSLAPTALSPSPPLIRPGTSRKK